MIYNDEEIEEKIIEALAKNYIDIRFIKSIKALDSEKIPINLTISQDQFTLKNIKNFSFGIILDSTQEIAFLEFIILNPNNN